MSEHAPYVRLRFAIQYFALFAMLSMVFNYVQLFLTARGFSDAQVGYLQGVMALAGVCGPILIGHLADRFGRRQALLICLVLFVAMLIPLNTISVFAIAATFMAGMGFFSNAAIPLTDTAASAELPDPARNYGRVRIWGSIGFVVTLLVIRSFSLVDEGSSTSILTAILVGAGLCFGSSMFLPDGRRARDRAEAAGPKGHFDRVFWLFVLVVAFHQLAMSSYYYFFLKFLRAEVKMEQAAWVSSIGAIAEIPMLFCGGLLVRRLGIRKMLMLSMVGVSLRLAIYAAAPTLVAILPAQLLHGATFGLLHAASIEFLRRKIPAGRRGLAMAIYMSLGLGLPRFLGSSLGGIVVERWGYATLYALYTLPPLVSLACLALAGRRFNPGLPE